MTKTCPRETSKRKNRWTRSGFDGLPGIRGILWRGQGAPLDQGHVGTNHHGLRRHRVHDRIQDWRCSPSPVITAPLRLSPVVYVIAMRSVLCLLGQ